MAEPNPFYAIQPAFTGGEISRDVASRVDLDKYQLSLLQAENAVIRPYGAVRKRPGMIYCGMTKYADKKCLLYHFDFSVDLSYMLEIGDQYIRIWRDGVYLGVELATPYTENDLAKLRFVQSVDVLYICSGNYPVKILSRYSETEWTFKTVGWTLQPFSDVNDDEDNKITPSATSGTITLTAVKDTFDAARIGETMKIEQYCNSGTVSVNANYQKDLDSQPTYTSRTLFVGKTWKVITHGTWTGSVTVELSKDGGMTWVELRKYTSKDDYNPTESGDVEEYSLLRVKVLLSSGSCNADLSSFPYMHVGYAKITAVTDAKTATASVKDTLGAVTPTADWYWEAWSETNGYPNCAAFFQDRLCFGGNYVYPQRVWMSKSGDYGNFGVDKEDGSVTDDSAVTADLLSQKTYNINHMDVGNDLIVFTDGSAWTISGAQTVTPSNITPRNQENYGTNDVLPIRIGNRAVYVQRRGSIVRDIGYSYDTDSYVGIDLTILARHLIKGRRLVGSAYAQEPDSMIFFVTDDGELICLTYVIEQKVYGWSHFVTEGTFESVVSVASGNNDRVYAVVKRSINGNTVRSIECFDLDHSTSGSQQDYVMMDCAKVYAFDTAQTELSGLEFLEGKDVEVMGDGYYFDEDTYVVTGGKLTLPQACKRVTVGIPYTMKLEQCNVDFGSTSSGTVQGRMKDVSSAILRLENSFGGKIGPDETHLNAVIYDPHRMELGEDVLYTGDQKVTLAAGGFNTAGRTFIVHDTPYPFSLSAIIRLVTFGG